VGYDLPPDGPPKFDAPAFAKWLTRHMAIRGIGTNELAARTGLSKDMIARLRRGGDVGRRTTRKSPMQVNINSLAAVAWALEMDFGHVAAKAGLQTGGDRWLPLFSLEERTKMATLLGGADPDDPDELDARLDAVSTPTEGE
jgi:hypothetical protein